MLPPRGTHDVLTCRYVMCAGRADSAARAVTAIVRRAWGRCGSAVRGFRTVASLFPVNREGFRGHQRGGAWWG
jgi:hypothetical protein